MKKIFVVLTLLACIFTAQAQTKKQGNKLLAKYSQAELNKLKKENPQEYKFAHYCADNAFYVANLSQKKVNANPSAFGEITINDLNNINFFELNIKLKQNDFQAFVIKGKNKLLMIKSKEFILKELKKK